MENGLGVETIPCLFLAGLGLACLRSLELGQDFAAWLVPAPDGLLRIHEVSTDVNSVKNTMTKAGANRLLVHIGMQKTGTTYLQNAVFPAIPDLTLVRGFEPTRKLHLAPAGNTVLISDERICGRPHVGGYYRQFTEAVSRLSDVYDDPKILIGFRKHDDLLLSLYKQFLHLGGDIDIEEYFAADTSAVLGFEDLGFRRRIELLRSKFSDVMVYTQEGLKNDEESFAASFKVFAGLPADGAARELPDQQAVTGNVGVRSVRQVKSLRRLNRLEKRLVSVSPKFSLNNRPFRRLRLTPRHLCQQRMGADGQRFELPDQMRVALSDHYESDWDFILAEELTQRERLLGSSSER